MISCNEFRLNNKTFNSEVELDLYLVKNRHNYTSKDGIHWTFSTNPIDITRAKLEEARVKNKGENVVEEIYSTNDAGTEYEVTKQRNIKIPNSMGMTTYMTKYGPTAEQGEKSISTPFDKPAVRKKIIARLELEGKTTEEAEKLADATIKSWDILTDVGVDVHDLIEKVMKGEQVGTSKLINKEVEKSFRADIKEFENFLKEKHGRNAVFMNEFHMISKTIDPLIVQNTNGKITSINGRIDLGVIDEVGNFHIYDFKVSRKDVGDWSETNNDIINRHKTYHSTKKRTIGHQLSGYKRIAQQYGITTKTVNIVPIKLDVEYEADGVSIKSINNISIDMTGLRRGDYTNVPGTGADGSQYKTMRQIFPIDVNYNGVDRIQSTFSKLDKIFGEKFVSEKMTPMAVKKNAAWYKSDKSREWAKLDDSSPKKNEGWNYVLYNKQTTKKLEYLKTEKDLFDAIDKYVEKINEYKGNELQELAEAIMDGNDPENLTDPRNTTKLNFLKMHFEKYIRQGWTLVNSENLIQSGIFIFKKDGYIEVRTITDKNLHNVNNMGMGTSIFGQKLMNTQVNFKEDLEASNGNLELMKAMMFIQENQDIFQDHVIISVNAMNIWMQQFTPSFNSQLVTNFEKLLRLNKDIKFTLNRNLFLNDVTAEMIQAEHLIDQNRYNMRIVDFELVRDFATQQFTADFIMAKMKMIKTRMDTKLASHDPKVVDPHDVAGKIYMHLNRALLAVNGVLLSDELDVGQYFHGGLGGTMITSNNYSPSANIRILGDIMAQYTNEIRNKVGEYIARIEKPFRTFYQDESNPHFMGGEANDFYDCFVQTNGKIDSRFILKKPEDPTFANQPKKREMIRTFLQIVNELRYGTDPLVIDEKINDGSYYEVPLLSADFARQWRHMKWKDIAITRAQEFKNIVENIPFDLAEEKAAYEQNNFALFNPFKDNSFTREARINKFGVDFFETDLERILRHYIVATVKEQISEHYVPVFQAIKIALNAQYLLGGQKLENVSEHINKYIKRVVYGEPIMEKSLQGFYRFASLLKDITSKFVLGGNLRSGLREILQGTYIGLSRTFANQLTDQIDAASHMRAFMYILTELHKSYNLIHFLELMNNQYGMANTSINELTDYFRLNQFGVRNWGSDQLFWFAKAPDFLHRMTFLVAKMMKDGSWEAHSYNEAQGSADYDFFKDVRYKQFIDGNKSHKDYAYQKALYLTNMEQFNREGQWGVFTYQEGQQIQALPRAYTIREGSGIKNFADLCYGHYDLETRAMINSTFLGSFFMQFKTFVTAKFEQWSLKPGVYNVESPKQQYDIDTKEELWKVYRWTNADGTGEVEWKVVKKSEIKPEEMAMAEPYIIFEGNPFEGMAYTLWSFVKATGKMDTDELAKLWKDDMKRANLWLALSDIGLMMILAWIIKAIFEWETLKDASPTKQFAAQVLYGATQDGPINNIVASMFGDLNPPTVTFVKGFVQNGWEMVKGEQNPVYFVTSQVGTLRELKQTTKNLLQH